MAVYSCSFKVYNQPALFFSILNGFGGFFLICILFFFCFFFSHLPVTVFGWG